MRSLNVRRVTKKVRAAFGAARQKKKHLRNERENGEILENSIVRTVVHARQPTRGGDAYVQSRFSHRLRDVKTPIYLLCMTRFFVLNPLK